jgi:hypothetical protein
VALLEEDLVVHHGFLVASQHQHMPTEDPECSTDLTISNNIVQAAIHDEIEGQFP